MKEQDYYIIDIPLDGDAPKQYVKAYFYYKNCPRKAKPADWHGFFVKFGRKSYPHESVTEYAINKIGEYLGLKMNETRLVVANGQVRFLSKDFIQPGKRLIHGIEILAEYFEDRAFVDQINEDRKIRREYLTFEVVERAINHVYPTECSEIIRELVKMITFDALVGNNDRHFYNWGVIGNVVTADHDETIFAPIYDSARALLWNLTEESVQKMYHAYLKGDLNQFEAYIRRPAPRLSFDDKPDAGHFELIDYLCSYKLEYKRTIEELVHDAKERGVLEKLKKDIYGFFSKERCMLIDAIIKRRFQMIRDLIV
ncbi:MAG: HipA domain-containing protein [Lewinellaceae bacterium]|nr:HipA domain-containing protein [Lewinellaceae bacterium]